MNERPLNPNLNGLMELGQRNNVDIRPTLLRVMTDLYVQKPTHSAEEERHYTELALRLIDLVDAPTRNIVAEKIAGYPNAPAAVRRRLLRETVSAANPAAHEPSPVQATSAPANPAAELSELFLTASAEERRLILLNLPYAAVPPAPAVAPAVAREAIQKLEAAALGHNMEAFARELERTLAISRAFARRLIDDPSGEAIVVVAVALAMPAAVLQRILLCLNPAIGRSVQRVYDLALLQEEVEPEAALRLIAIWQVGHMPQARTAPAPSAPRQPQHRPDPRGVPAAPPARPKIPWDEIAQAGKADSA